MSANTDFLMERVVMALEDRTGYYIVIGEERLGPFNADQAYELWEDQMQGEVRYYNGYKMTDPE